MTLSLFVALASLPQDPGPTRLPTVVVEGRAESLVGIAERASEGVVGGEELARRPIQRPAELLEAVPGVVATQHSGSGKSNQLFVRGFDLDHGTDLATTLFGVPLNMPSHGHGQGYTDLNPLLPELVDTVRWRLGPYDVRDGDFASAGAVDIDYVRRIDPFAKFTVGPDGYARSLFAGSHRVGDGDLLLALELLHDDGPFDVEQGYQKRNGYASWSSERLRVAAFAHDAGWTATDQIPRRAVRSGQLSRFGSTDPTSGGDTTWYGTVAEWRPAVADGSAMVRAFVQHYELDLFSNFTYALVDPVRGDQIEQRDERTVAGFTAERSFWLNAGGMIGQVTVGSEYRGDWIRNGLFASAQRTRSATVRRDGIDVHALSVYGELRLEPCDWLRGTIGLRGDHQRFDVASDLAANSGNEHASIGNGKGGIAIGPWLRSELYANAGTGFHSNDARGVLLRDDPTTSQPGDGTAVDPLVRSKGAEVGVRTNAVAGLHSTVSAWWLELDSELLYVGDAGTNEPSRASRRHGFEFANHWQPLSWLTLDADATFAHARFRGNDPGGDHIPGTLPMTLVGGLDIACSDAVSVGVRVRHLGNRPLLEDGSVRSSSTTLVNARAAWQIDARREFALDVLNLLDRDDSDIEYFYGSQLPGESAAVDDVHFHPVEPFGVRLSFTARF